MNEKILNTLDINFENDFSGRHPIYLRDDITARWEHGFEINSPKFTSQQLDLVMPFIQKCSADLLNLIGRDTPEGEKKMMPMVSGRLLHYIMNLESKISILGAHDTTGFNPEVLVLINVKLFSGSNVNGTESVSRSELTMAPFLCSH